MMYSKLEVSEDPVFDFAGAMAFGPGDTLNVFATEYVVLNMSMAAKVQTVPLETSGGLDLDNEDTKTTAQLSVDDEMLVDVTVTGTSVTASLGGENYVNATMGGSIFMGGTDDGYAIEIDQLWIDVVAPIEFSFGVLDVTADVTELWFIIPTYDSSVEVSYIDPDTSYATDFYMNLVGKEVGTTTTTPGGYDLVESSPLYTSGYTFESDDLVLYSKLKVSDQYLYDGAAAMAWGPNDNEFNIFATEAYMLNTSAACKLDYAAPDLGGSGGLDLDNETAYMVLGVSVDDEMLVDVTVTGTSVTASLGGENYVNATMGGSIFMGGTDDGYAIEIDQLWIDVVAPIEFSFGVLDVTADVTELWFIIPTYDSSVEVSYIDPDTSYATDFYMNLVGKEVGTTTTTPGGYDLAFTSPVIDDGYTFESDDLVLYSKLIIPAVHDVPIYDAVAALAFGPGSSLNILATDGGYWFNSSMLASITFDNFPFMKGGFDVKPHEGTKRFTMVADFNDNGDTSMDLAGDSPLFPKGYVFESGDLMLSSSLYWDDSTVYNMTAAIADGPGDGRSFFLVEEENDLAYVITLSRTWEVHLDEEVRVNGATT